jgi:hypothetical protein
MYNYSDLTPISSYHWDLRESGVIQKYPIKLKVVGDEANGSEFEIIASRNGAHLCAICETKNLITYQTLSLNVDEEYWKEGIHFDYPINLEDPDKLDAVPGDSEEIVLDDPYVNEDDKVFDHELTKHKWMLTNTCELIGIDLHK